MNIAIVGAGISGISAAYNLQKNHQVTLIEKNKKLGGHSNTIHVKDDNGDDFSAKCIYDNHSSSTANFSFISKITQKR